MKSKSFSKIVAGIIAILASASSCNKQGENNDKSLEIVTSTASDISISSATVNGYLKLSSPEILSSVNYGVIYSTDPDFTPDSGIMKKASSLGSDDKFSVSLSELSHSSTYYYMAFVKYVDTGNLQHGEVMSFTTPALPSPTSTEKVSLGLSVKWRGWNIGASKPEESGTYFAWGDVQGQTWNGSIWSGGGFSKYFSYKLDSKNNLMPEYDAAHVKLGGDWRMPTEEEFQELIDYCDKAWTSVNGIWGWLFVSKKRFYEDKAIFLPVAGRGVGIGLNDADKGNYWSSTFYSTTRDKNLFLRSDDVYTSSDYRDFGMPIRPVSE